MLWASPNSKVQHKGTSSNKQLVDRLTADYTAGEFEFLKAVQQLKKKFPFPSWNQVYDVFMSLGYSKKVAP